ncbi:MAG TPA: heparinase II/III family protein, partial [Myxococcales bacterium]
MFVKRARGRPADFLLRKTVDLAARYLRVASSRAGKNPYASPSRRGDELRLGLLTAPAAISSTLKRFATSEPSELSHVIAVADRAVSGRFTVLSNTTSADPETWDCDFVSGARWPVRFHSLYAYSDLLDLGRPSDVKVPWELARLQALPVMALAFVITGDERYARACSARFSSWDRACPVGFGINWTVGMEVALRAISLILTAEFLAGSTFAREFVTDRLVESLGEHGRFLYRNIEYSDINGNHYVSCLIGLLYLGLALPRHAEAAAWRETAVTGLRREIIAESYPDGVCHEGS